MFEQALVLESPARQGWSFAGSIAIQVIGLGVLVLIPLLNTYEIDLAAWSLGTFTLAPPPPPAPPPPRATPAPAPQAVRFEADFQAPSVIPDEIAFLHDVGDPVSGIAALPMSAGLPGGTGDPGIAGVLGMFPTVDSAPLPPPVRVGGRGPECAHHAQGPARLPPGGGRAAGRRQRAAGSDHRRRRPRPRPEAGGGAIRCWRRRPSRRSPSGNTARPS